MYACRHPGDSCVAAAEYAARTDPDARAALDESNVETWRRAYLNIETSSYPAMQLNHEALVLPLHVIDYTQQYLYP